MAEEFKNQNNNQPLNLTDKLAAPTPPTPSIGGFDVSSPLSGAPTIPSAEPRKPVASEIPAVRTLRGDIQEYTQKSKTSYFDVVAAAQKKHAPLAEEWSVAPQKVKSAVILAAIVAVFSLLAAGYFLLSKEQKTGAPPIARPAPSLIYADNERILEYTGDNKILLDDIQIALSRPQLTNEFTYLAVKTRVADSDIFFGPADLLKAAGAVVTDELKLAFTTPFTFGIIDTFGENETILLLKAVNYDKTLAAMLAWERTMPRDLSKLLPKNINRDYGEAKFKDIVVKNQDARILSNLEGRPILAYTIFNRKLVVIASSKAALEAVIDKLIASPPNL